MNNRFHHICRERLRLLTALLIATILLLAAALPTTTANAASSQGTLTITPKHGDSTVPASYDGTFSLYLIATGIESGAFDLTENFATYDGTAITKDNLEDETTYKVIAQDLTAYIAQQGTAGKTIEPDLNDLKAHTAYTLSYGLYLVTQQDAGSTYNACTPILVTIPSYSVDADGTRHTTTDVTAYPKLTKPDEPGDHHEPPTPPTHYGKVALGKSDAETGTPLQGVVFNLYKRDMNGDWVVIGTYTTDEQGIVYVDHLSYGEYYWEEAQTLDGYILDQTPQEFKVNSEDLVRLTMTNTRIPETPEAQGEERGFTGDSSHMMLYGVVAIAAAVGLLVWMYKRRKE